MTNYQCARWACDLTNYTPALMQLAYAISCVQSEERDRIMKLHYFEDFLSALVGRMMMRKFVSQYAKVDHRNVVFARELNGKPYWVGHADAVDEKQCCPQLTFNVSHQGAFVVLAGVKSDAPWVPVPDFGVGVDVMKVEYHGGKPQSEFFRLMKTKFSQNEWNNISRAEYSEHESLKQFMRHWCLKEAFVKESGVGIYADLHRISFNVDPSDKLEVSPLPLTSTKLIYNNLDMENWCFEEHMLAPLYCAAIAFKNYIPPKAAFQLMQFDDFVVASDGMEIDKNLLWYCSTALKKDRKYIK